MIIHAGRCEWNNEFKIERILTCKGPLCDHKYRIRWKNYQEEDETWEAHTNLNPVTTKQFDLGNDLYDHSWPFGYCKVHVVKDHGKNDVTVKKERPSHDMSPLLLPESLSV